MNSEEVLKKLRNLVIENKDNRKEISSLFDVLRDLDRHERDKEMMKKIKMKYVGIDNK